MFNFKMAGFREREKREFPLADSRSVLEFFKSQLQSQSEPNLALLSIVLGFVENTLTVNRCNPQELDSGQSLELVFPVVEVEVVEALYQKFITQIKASVDLTKFRSQYATRELVKRLADVIWSNLTRSYYKDKAHLQSLYSYLTGQLLS